MGKQYSEETEQVIEAYENEIAAQQQMMQQSNSTPYSSTMFGGQQKQNLVEWQLDFKSELEDIERLLRCDILMRDKEGNEVWVQNPNKEEVFLNDLGVNAALRHIRMFLNKNKVLSNYGVDEIQPRLKMFSHELRVLIYNNYEAYGMDNEYKQNNYSMIVLTISAMIEDSYRRALNGEERRDLNSARIVNQNESNGGQQMMPYSMNMGSHNKKKWYNPLSWGN